MSSRGRGRGNHHKKTGTTGWGVYEPSTSNAQTISNFMKRSKYNPPDKNLTCNKCNKHFDLTTRYPILYDCAHSECEECVTVAVTCSTCNVGQLPAGTLPRRRENLPINYYVVGRLMCKTFEKRNKSFSESSQIPFISAASRSSIDQIKDETYGTKCSSRMCNRQATLRCLDCLEVYCTLCSDKLHQSAKGLKTHKVLSLSVPICDQHDGNLEEFNCIECNLLICSYCAIAEHNGHTIKQITKLDVLEIPKMERLLDDCQATLMKLGNIDKKLQSTFKNNNFVINSEAVEQDIISSFLELHAKLQLQESKLISRIKTMKTENTSNIRQKLATQIQEIYSVVSLAKSILVNRQMPGQDIGKVIETMEKVRQIQVSDYDQQMDLVFNCGDLIRNMESNFSLTLQPKETQNVSSVKPNKKRLSSYNDGTTSDSSFSSRVSSTDKLTKNNSIYNSYTSLRSCFMNDVPNTPTRSNISSVVPIMRNNDVFQDFERKVLKKNDREYVQVTHIDSLDRFYVQLTNQNKQLAVLNKMLKNYFTLEHRNPVELPQINEQYIVSNKKWCRATCLYENPDGSYKFQLIDYGNTVVVPKNKIFEMSPELVNKPQLAYCCKLFAYPVADVWGSDVKGLIQDIISDYEVLMVVYKEINSILEVDLIASCDDTEYSIRDSLIFIGYARPFDKDSGEDQPKTTRQRKLAIYSQTLSLKPQQKCLVNISHVNNPLDLYVQQCNLKEKLERLTEQMSSHYEKMKKGYVFNPEIDMIVAVNKMKDSGIWYRGQIKDIKQGQGKVIVFLVDFGEIITVSWNDIRNIDEKFVTLNSMATNVRLVHIENRQKTWKQECIDYLKKYIKTKEKLEMVIEDIQLPISVLLFEKQLEFDLCINAELAIDPSIKSTGHLSAEVEWPKLLTGQHVDLETFTHNLIKTTQGCNSDEESSDEDDSHLYVYKPIEVLHVKNAGSIYVHFTQETSIMEKLVELNVRLQTYCNQNSLQTKSSWEEGEIGVAIDYSKRQYFRVMIEKVFEDKYLVLSRDYAHRFYANKEGIGILDESFLTQPPFAYRCHMYGVKPSGSDWTLTSIDYLTDYFKKKNIFFTKAGPCENQSTPCVFWYREFKSGGALERATFKMHNINKNLVKNGLAIKDKMWDIPKRQSLEATIKIEAVDSDETTDNVVVDGRKGTWLPALPMRSSNFDTVATFVDDDCLIYFNEFEDKKLLRKMETTMTKHFKNLPNSGGIDWEVGDRCSVKYHKNRVWYRGLVVGTDNTTKIQLIDYGNVEEVECDEIHCDIMYEDVPTLSKRVKLYGVFPPEGGYTLTQLDTIHSFIVDQRIHIYIKQTGLISEAIVHQGHKIINELMVMKLNCLKAPEKRSSSSDNDDMDVIVESASTNSSFVEESVMEYISKELPTKDSFIATIVNYIDYNRIIFMLPDEEEDKLVFEELTSKIQMEASRQPFLTTYTLHQPCIAIYENMWYRGLIYHHNPDQDMVSVFFVDFGNLEYVDENDVRAIKQEWMSYPTTQYNALLDGFDSIKEDDKSLVCNVLDTFFDSDKYIKIIEREPLTVQIFNLDNKKKLAYQTLICDGILLSK